MWIKNDFLNVKLIVMLSKERSMNRRALHDLRNQKNIEIAVVILAEILWESFLLTGVLLEFVNCKEICQYC